MKVVRTSGRGAKEAQRLLGQLTRRGESGADSPVAAKVRRIVDGVRRGGDVALRRYIARLDGHSTESSLQITSEEMRQAWEETPRELRAALKLAAGNIRKFAQRQLPREWNYSPAEGLVTGQLVRPLEAVGCYVPSGRYPLPSTLLM